jgi:hypothetical protein
MLATHHQEYYAALATAKNRIPQSFQCPLFSALVGHITPFALWQVYEQKQILDQPTLHHPYRRTLLDSMGIPCYHVIQDRINRNEVLSQDDFHPCWHFSRALGNSAIPRPILNSHTVHTRGWPRGSKNKQPVSSTARDPSRFEESSTAKEKPVTRPRKRT